MKKLSLILTFLLLLSAVQLFAQFETIWEKKMPGLAQIGDVKFSHNSQMLLCLVPGQKTYVYNANNGELISDKVINLSGPVFSLDDTHIYGFGGKHIAYIDIMSGIDESKLQDADTNLVSAIISKDQRYYLGLTYNTLLVWDIESGQIIKRKQLIFEKPQFPLYYSSFNEVQALNISCDNSKIYISFWERYFDYSDQNGNHYKYERRLNEYDFITLDSVKCLHNWKTGDKGPVLSTISFSNDCSLFVFQPAGANPPNITIHHFPSMKLKNEIPYFERYKFSSDDKYLVTASAYKRLLSLYDVETGELLKQRFGGSFSTLDISKDLNKVVTSTGYNLYVLNSTITSNIEEKEAKEIRIFPNPATNILHIINDAPFEYKIVDIYGRELLSGGAESENAELDIRALASGSYLCKIKLQSGIHVQKFQVVR